MDITIYSKDNCPACTKLKSLLRVRRLDYTEHKVGTEITKEEVEAIVGKTIHSVPQVVIDGTHVGGFQDTEKFLDKQ